ncbi:MAG TPA: hypothetical protein VFL45_10750 [Gammaproteobacteria bacterium]|nr:hypothetical protein [Gammaproteobacteria bacterium]HET7588541.1 hypothetical protein [Gammaproteobacteria bacterium]
MKDFLAWLMRSRLARVGMAALLGLVRLFGPFSGGVIALVTLRHGWLEGLLTTLGASIVLAAIEMGLVHGGLFVLTLPTLVLWWVIIGLALVLRRTASLALMMQAATALGCLAVALFFLANPNPLEFWTPLLKQLLLPMLQGSTAAMQRDWTLVIERMAMLMTGVTGASLALGSSLAVLCGRWGQAVLYNPGGFRDAFHRLRMGWIATLAASCVFVLAGLFNNVFIDNLAIVLLVMFMYQGLAVIHGIAGYKKVHAGWLAAFYTLFVLEFLYVLAIVAGVGLIDNWFDIRARVARKKA